MDTCSFDVIITSNSNDIAETRSAEKTENISTELDFNIYPNPVTTLLYVDIKSELSQINEIQIFQSNGQLINTLNSERLERNGVDVSSYSSGLYFMKLTDTIGNFKVKKFTVR